MNRRCVESEFEVILAIINDAARAYEGIIPTDRWRDPYMSEEELRREINDGVVFWGYEEAGALVAVMGVQDVEDVTLIRHAYVRTARRNRGIGGELLAHLVGETSSPMLIGTWAAAEWAVRFYEHRGFHVVSEEEKDRLLKRYWAIPERQIETSVVLADQRWLDAPR
jgi:N-acetylglutamate synthase-like GNAT family acetyltransferase